VGLVGTAVYAAAAPMGKMQTCAPALPPRYWDLDDQARAEDLAAILASDQVRVVLQP
jgi:hypothetical protein